MALDPAKTLDIDAIEAALDELLENYRQALRAVELLPIWGHVPNKEYPHADWVRSHLAIRRLVRMFLRSHILSKLRTIADHLEVERFASGHMDANTSKRFDGIIRKLHAYDKFLTRSRTIWLRSLPGWIWVVVAPVLTTYLLGIPSLKVPAGEILGNIIIYLLLFVSLFCIPIYLFGALAGFYWKRLILLGQTGNMNIDSPANIVLGWVPVPQANTYESENRFFRTLGLPKPDEIPWDVLLAPLTLMLTALALAFFLLALAFLPAATEPNWPALIAIVLFVASVFCVDSVRRLIDREMRKRRQRSAC